MSAITIAHVYTSYRGFQLLESGLSYTLFYLYPIIILMMSGRNVHPVMLVTLLGVYLLTTGNGGSSFEMMGQLEGIVMILLAGLTEAFIYFVVRRLKTDNSWNHLFLSYFAGVVIMTLFMYDKLKDVLSVSPTNILNVSIGINVVIGLFGYLLRFFAISRLDTTLYSILSYVGVVMAYVYGMLFNEDILTFKKIMGTLCVIVPNLYLSKFRNI